MAILVWLTVVEERPRIEADLTARTQQALKVAGVDWANLTFSGREGTLAGHTSHDSNQKRPFKSRTAFGASGRWQPISGEPTR